MKSILSRPYRLNKKVLVSIFWLLKNKERKLTQIFNSSFHYVDDVRLLSVSHLLKWAWSKGYYWHPKICFLPWPSHWNQLQRKTKL